jgi:hypothetical protein
MTELYPELRKRELRVLPGGGLRLPQQPDRAQRPGPMVADGGYNMVGA